MRDFAGRELVLPSWERAMAEDWLGKWALNLMLLNVSTRKFRRRCGFRRVTCRHRRLRSVEVGGFPHFVALSGARLREWLAADLSGLDPLVVQIDGIHISEHLVLVAAIGIDALGIKHPLALIEGATENTAVAQALIDDLIARGLDPAVPRLFIIDGSKALSRAIRRSFGRHTQSSAAKSTKPATSWNDCRSRCMLRSAVRCVKPASLTMPQMPNDSFATSRSAWNVRRPWCLAAFSRGSMRYSRSRGSVCRPS